jgi:hypothetical protein
VAGWWWEQMRRKAEAKGGRDEQRQMLADRASKRGTAWDLPTDAMQARGKRMVQGADSKSSPLPLFVQRLQLEW